MIDVGLRAGCVWVQLHCLKGAYENLSGLDLGSKDLTGFRVTPENLRLDIILTGT